MVSLLVGVWSSAGCRNLFVARQRVQVDAISAPGAAKLAGQSYRLVARKSVVNSQQAQLLVIRACLNAALISKGMFESPPNVPPDVFIEVSYGMDMAARVDPSTRESYLQLSARPNSTRSLDGTKDEEVWDVRVAIMGLAGRLETAMPMLCTIAAGNAGLDTRVETTIQVLENSPEVTAVRNAAIKILDSHNPPAPAPSAAK